MCTPRMQLIKGVRIRNRQVRKQINLSVPNPESNYFPFRFFVRGPQKLIKHGNYKTLVSHQGIVINGRSNGRGFDVFQIFKGSTQHKGGSTRKIGHDFEQR